VRQPGRPRTSRNLEAADHRGRTWKFCPVFLVFRPPASSSSFLDPAGFPVWDLHRTREKESLLSTHHISLKAQLNSLTLSLPPLLHHNTMPAAPATHLNGSDGSNITLAPPKFNDQGERTGKKNSFLPSPFPPGLSASPLLSSSLPLSSRSHFADFRSSLLQIWLLLLMSTVPTRPSSRPFC